jgi:hypothetical protein
LWTGSSIFEGHGDLITLHGHFLYFSSIYLLNHRADTHGFWFFGTAPRSGKTYYSGNEEQSCKNNNEILDKITHKNGLNDTFEYSIGNGEKSKWYTCIRKSTTVKTTSQSQWFFVFSTSSHSYQTYFRRR